VLIAHASVPETAEITGFSGNAFEWEVTAKLTRVGDTRELAGPMKMTHVGWCIQAGPEEKTGEMRVRLARLTSSIEARVNFDGIGCSYSGTLTDAYEGRLFCPDRRAVQMLLWLK
jgi:hypothetical protein